MAEQHAQAWITEHLYDAIETTRYRRGRPRLVTELKPKPELAAYAWRLLDWLVGRRTDEPRAPRPKPVIGPTEAMIAQVQRIVRRELAR